ncbi:MAG: hypothetical protein ACLUSL_09880 [Ruminococcus sp.]
MAVVAIQSRHLSFEHELVPHAPQKKDRVRLYNILGMGKWNLARILVLQTMMFLVTSLAGGLGLGSHPSWRNFWQHGRSNTDTSLALHC